MPTYITLQAVQQVQQGWAHEVGERGGQVQPDPDPDPGSLHGLHHRGVKHDRGDSFEIQGDFL